MMIIIINATASNKQSDEYRQKSNRTPQASCLMFPEGIALFWLVFRDIVVVYFSNTASTMQIKGQIGQSHHRQSSVATRKAIANGSQVTLRIISAFIIAFIGLTNGIKVRSKDACIQLHAVDHEQSQAKAQHTTGNNVIAFQLERLTRFQNRSHYQLYDQWYYYSDDYQYDIIDTLVEHVQIIIQIYNVLNYSISSSDLLNGNGTFVLGYA
mmetsp:Transcript_32919/g.49697  ORF Transcript_32919/g.49697 Transcript_32919/m.49697 type:complete len:211 (+) Transcript_32919:1200-1832(+)